MAGGPVLSHEIREAFLRFFEERGHLRVPSSSLVPQGDPTLLLTSAGMVQFKPYFTGERQPPRARLASVQRCFRATDIDAVGDPKHLTLFEMLGNFSIGGQEGSYFKAEAIAWAWEFLTRVLRLPSERLWATVYLDDDEAWDLWRAQGVPAERMRRYGESENFWGPPGDSGPCGPCSELHYDFGGPCRQGKPEAECGPACPCGRFVELWNLVFTQYHQATDGIRRPLERKNIDTGAGLERLAMALQGVTTAYDTDLFQPLIGCVCQLAGVSYGGDERRDRAIRVVAEHARSAAFLIADGIVPSNAGRGYVLRRLIRRAVYLARTRLVLNVAFMAPTIRQVIGLMTPHYPELLEKGALVVDLAGQEEEKFTKTMGQGRGLLSGISSYRSYLKDVFSKVIRDPGLRANLVGYPFGSLFGSSELSGPAPSAIKTLIDNEFKQILGEEYWKADPQKYQEALSRAQRLTGKEIFVLWDTYGFPPELTREIAPTPTYGLEVPEEAMPGFERELSAQRERSRAASAALFGTGAEAAEALAALGLPPTRFLGYQAPSTGSGQALEHSTTVIGLLVDGQSVDAVEDGQQAEAILIETPFYPEGGGQVGDAGEIAGDQGSLRVDDTQRPGAGIIVHRGKVTGRLSVGDAVVARVDTARRADIMRNHTATHLLHAALRQVLGEHVAQAGSLVAPDRLRFDFHHLASLTPEELRRVEELVNQKVLADLPVRPRETTYSVAVAEGALAFFGEKYGDSVRVVEVCETPAAADAPCQRAFSKELCGGTHCAATGQVGLFQIVSESSIGAGLRRVEAVTGRSAHERVRQRFDALEAIANQFRTSPDRVLEKLAALAAELEQERRRASALERELLKSTMEGLLGKVRRLGGVQVVAARVPAGSPEALRQMGDWLRDRLVSAVIVLGSIVNDRPQFVAMVTPDLVAQGYHAGQLLKAVAAVAGGGGGGRADMAQAGGRDKGKLDEALRLVEKLVLERGRLQA